MKAYNHSQLGLQYQTWIPSCGVGLKCNQKVIGCFHNSYATISLMAHLAWQISNEAHRHSWDRLLLTLLPTTTTTEACKEPSGIMKSDQLKGSFQFSFIFFHLIVSNQVLSSVILFCNFATRSHYVPQAGLELMEIFPHPPSKCYEKKCTPMSV